MLCHVEDDRARNGRVTATDQSPEVVKVSCPGSPVEFEKNSTII